MCGTPDNTSTGMSTPMGLDIAALTATITSQLSFSVNQQLADLTSTINKNQSALLLHFGTGMKTQNKKVEEVGIKVEQQGHRITGIDDKINKQTDELAKLTNIVFQLEQAGSEMHVDQGHNNKGLAPSTSGAPTPLTFALVEPPLTTPKRWR